MNQVIIRKEPALGLDGEKEYQYVSVAGEEAALYHWCVKEEGKWRIYNTPRVGILPSADVIYGPFLLESQARHHLQEKFGVTA